MKAMMALKDEFDGELITQIVGFGSFKLNSEEFLNYYATDPDRPFCKNYIEPKLKLLLERFGNSVVKSPVKKEINH